MRMILIALLSLLPWHGAHAADCEELHDAIEADLETVGNGLYIECRESGSSRSTCSKYKPEAMEVIESAQEKYEEWKKNDCISSSSFCISIPLKAWGVGKTIIEYGHHC